jgi:DNA processing protein
LVWPQVSGIGPHRLKQLFAHFGSLEAAWQSSETDLLSVAGIGEKLAAAIRETRDRLDPASVSGSDSCLANANDPLSGIKLLTPADPGYPPLLWEIPDPPPTLYLRGDPQPWSPAVAVVGTRSPTAYGRRWTELLVRGLVEAGCSVVSGMALGIDGVAHRAALNAGGRTIAVLGTGVDVVYPPRHQSLYDAICTQGAVVSEFPPGTQPAKEHFPRRNRTIAGLCQATLVLEAPERSGALITTRFANDYNREVYALPGSLDTREAQGCLQLIREGAGLILGVSELLQELGLADAPNAAQPHRADMLSPLEPPPLSDRELTVWQALETSAIAFDVLAEVTRLDAGTLSSTLLMMELAGIVEQLPGMRYRRAASYRSGMDPETSAGG